MLIVETGSGLANADSYITLIDARALAEKYGLTLPDDDTAAEVALRNGAAYVDMQEARFSGERATWTQALAWPRTNASTAYGSDIQSDSIPPQVLKSQVCAAAEYGSGTDVRATDDGKAIASEEVTGAVAVSYFNNGKTGTTVTITKAIDALKPLMTSCKNTGFEFRVGRA
ncbi:MAG: DnaT-like ssDNA-binding protein [Plesiomonas sp.]